MEKGRGELKEIFLEKKKESLSQQIIFEIEEAEEAKRGMLMWEENAIIGPFLYTLSAYTFLSFFTYPMFLEFGYILFFIINKKRKRKKKKMLVISELKILKFKF